uniref:sortase n=1 Tax=Candidatus Limivicinus sp. TaxID=3030905 RepID=UPI003FF063C2
MGDTVYIDNIWTLMKYEVTDIQVISPDDVDAIKIQHGCDLVTLLTCYPPNTGGRQRLLVFCERSEE